MGALPKNKITRVEQGKRRAGNKPSLKKDAKKASIPTHKQGLVASILKKLDLNKINFIRLGSSLIIESKLSIFSIASLAFFP